MTNAEVNQVRRDLTGMIIGRVLDGGDQGYSDTLSIDNGRVTLKPFLVAKPANTDDVSKIVRLLSRPQRADDDEGGRPQRRRLLSQRRGGRARPRGH